LTTAEEKNVSTSREFLKALEAKHIAQVLSCFTDDGVWISPEGTFTGKTQISGYLEWQYSQAEDLKLKECENGIVVEGDRAFIELSISYRRDGEHIEYIVLCSLELKEGKVNRIRTVYDRLSLGRKLARDRVSKWAINHAIKQAENKLHWR
jgi:ketosteroid isomerase-like protein